MTFPYLIPAQPMTQATAMIQHGEVPSPCLKLLCAKGPHEMSHRPLLSQGNGADRLCSGQLPTRSQDTAKLSTRRAEGEHTRSQGPPLPSHHFAESHPFSKDATRPAGSITTVHGIHTSRADMRSLSPKCVSCCHLSSG